jgi:perilipin-2
MATEFDSTTTCAHTMQLPKFVSRVYAYPIVNDACGQVANVYSKVKDCNRVMHAGLDLAESGLKMVSSTATPIITKFDNQITYIDDLTCKQLDKLEEKIPVVTKPTKEVSNEAKVYINGAIAPKVEAVGNAYQNVKDKVTSVHEYGKTQLMKVTDTSYGKFALGKVDDALEITDKYLEHYLPEDGNKLKGEKFAKPQDTLGKAGYLTTKMRKRMFAKAMTQMQQVKVRSSEAVEKMNFTVDLISYAKTHLQTVADKATHLEHDFKYKLWELETAEAEEMKQVEMKQMNEECNAIEESNETEKTKERKLLKSLLYWSHKLNLSLQAGKAVFVENVPIPENVKHAYAAATETADKLYKQLSHLQPKSYLESIPLVKTSFATIDYYLKSVFDYADDAYKHLVARKEDITRKMKSSGASVNETKIKSECDPNKSTSSESFTSTQEENNNVDAHENTRDTNVVKGDGEESDDDDDEEEEEEEEDENDDNEVHP